MEILITNYGIQVLLKGNSPHSLLDVSTGDRDWKELIISIGLIREPSRLRELKGIAPVFPDRSLIKSGGMEDNFGRHSSKGLAGLRERFQRR
jgi:hypothetical protein